MMTLHREPLVQFLILGGLIFVAFALTDDTLFAERRERIEVTEAETARLGRQFEASVGRPPFEDVREQVELEWRRAKARQDYDALLSRYEIKRPGARDAAFPR